MGGARETPDSASTRRDDALREGRDRTERRAVGPPGLLALQRSAGNAAVSALLAGRMRGAPVGEVDAALREVRRDEPVIETVEKGLRAAKAAGVPVDLDGAAQKPPAAALNVVRTGFGPEAVPAKKPVPPRKPVPAVSPLGKAAARPAAPKGAGSVRGAAPTPAPAVGAPSSAAPSSAAPASLTSDRLLAPPVPPPGVRPAGDPAFGRVAGAVKGVAAAKRAHPPAAAKAKEAQDAAVAPADDLAGQAKAAKVDTMDAQQPGTFDKKAFIAAVKAAIEAKSPKTLKEADEYKKSGKAGEVKGEVTGLVTGGKEGQARDIEAATDAPPDQSKAVAKPVTPLAPEQPGPPPAVDGAGAAPKPAPPEQTNLAAGTAEANQEMAQGEVTEAQLAQSNEPQFQGALADKQAAAAHAHAAPTEFRQQEQQVIGQQKADASAQATAGVAGMQSSKGAALASLVAAKGATKTKDEAKRAEVTTKIQGIFTATEKDVKAILDGLDPKVDKAFTEGEAAARQAFETYVDAKMRAYKKDRYGGWLGGLRWAKDKLVGMPDKVNEFYTAGRELYLKQMDGVITRVADIVGGDLTAAKKRIATGRAEIATYVKSLPADLQKLGATASKEIGEKFTALESDVDAKRDEMVDALATRYTEARKGLDERIEALQAENKGLVDKAIGAIKAVINTIRELAAMLRNVLSRVAGVVGDIIKAPVKFLGNLVAGVKGGILKFKDNILDHLRKGLMSWLFGALAEAGVELPEKFDLMGIIRLLASIFGLTWTNIRNRIVKQVGEKAMGAIEKGVEIFSVLRTQGVAGLWQMLMDKLGDIKEMILAQVKDFVITKIITAGITWLIGLLNPAAAFIKACKMIYDVVMFFVDNGSRILKFVNTVIDSVADIVKGNVSGVVNKINDVLGQMVPIIIGFLASLIGLGGIGAKIRSIIETLQKPVNKALDFVIKTGLKLAGPIIRGIKGISGKVKAKVAAGKAWVRGKVEAGKEWAKGKVEAGKKWAKGKLGINEKAAKEDADGKDRERHEAIAKSVAHDMKQPVSDANDADALRRNKLDQAKRLEQAHQPSLRSGIRISIHEAEPGDARHLRFRVQIAPNTTTMTFPVGFTVTIRQFVSIDSEWMYNAESHIEQRHVRLKGDFATRDELAERVLRGYSDVMTGPGGTAPANFNEPSKAGYFMSVEEANAQLRQVVNGELPGRWAQAQAALEGPNHYFSWTSNLRFPRHPQAGLQRNSALGTKNQLRALLAANEVPHPTEAGTTYRIHPLYPGDPNYIFDSAAGHPDNSNTPLTIPEFPGADYPVYVGLKADPAPHVRGGWYVNSAYPST